MWVLFNDFSVHIWCIESFLCRLFSEAQKFPSSLRSCPSRTSVNLHFSFSSLNVWALPCASNMYINVNDDFKSHYWAFSNAHSRSGCQNGSTISLISTFSLWIYFLQIWPNVDTHMLRQSKCEQETGRERIEIFSEFLQKLDLFHHKSGQLHYVVLF